MTGPEELSIEEIVKIIGAASGRELKYVDETVEEAYESRKNGRQSSGNMMHGLAHILLLQ